jgi:mercuric ion transport protein
MTSPAHNVASIDHSPDLADRIRAPSLGTGQKLAAAGGIIAALAASSCCILPLALFGLGISGAWIGNLTQLAPFQPFFIAATLACVGTGYWLVYRSSKLACGDGAACARPPPNKFVKVALIVATAIVLMAWAFDYLAPYLLP